jgi:hypothetical protein
MNERINLRCMRRTTSPDLEDDRTKGKYLNLLVGLLANLAGALTATLVRYPCLLISNL